MGRGQSKEKEAEPPAPKDDRWVLSRNFGSKTTEYHAKAAELNFRSLNDLLPRPVHVSCVDRMWPA